MRGTRAARNARARWRGGVLTLLMLAVVAWPRRAHAWLFSEHWDISSLALGRLDIEDRRVLDRLWAQARAGQGARWCASMAQHEQQMTPTCVDFAAWPALAGDHSCSARELVNQALPSDWVLPVMAVATETEVALATTRSREDKLNALATANLHLQQVDPEYATRADSNIAHFLLPRRGEDAVSYARACVAEGADLNALGIYAQQHLAALAAAQRLSTSSGKNPAERARDARRILALEAFALHWLEDAFAAGHTVGTWGATAWRKGTHDYYNEFGLDAVSWDGEPITVFGDGNMKRADLERAARVAALSLKQLARALMPGDPLGVASQHVGLGPEGAYVFDACSQLVQPSPRGGDPARIIPQMKEILLALPIPGRGPGDVHLPRFREELGPFLGLFGSIGGGVAWGGPVSSEARASGGLGAGLRLGFGAESLTGTPGTSTVFVEGGLQMMAPEANRCKSADCSAIGSSSLFPALPARTGLRLGLRLPFWVLPGDMLLLTPILAVVSPRALSQVAVAAASGGLIPYERTFITRAGSFQFVAGREVQVTMFGYLGEATIPLYVAPVSSDAEGSPQYAVIAQKTMALSFPVVEWTPFREFATQLTFATCVQLGWGLEVPLQTRVRYPEGAPQPTTSPVWTVFLRGQFDGRYFVGNREDLNPPR